MCGMVWYDKLWMICYVCGVYYMIWYSMYVWYDMIWYGMINYERYVMVCWVYDMIWYGMICDDMLWYDMLCDDML